MSDHWCRTGSSSIHRKGGEASRGAVLSMNSDARGCDREPKFNRDMRCAKVRVHEIRAARLLCCPEPFNGWSRAQTSVFVVVACGSDAFSAASGSNEKKII